MAGRSRANTPTVIERIRRFLIEHPGLEPPRSIVVGLSGGQDSCTLLHGLTALREECGLDLFAAHLNHRIRGEEADEDQRFAESFAASLGIECFSSRTDVRAVARRLHRSLQEAAREARRRFLGETADAVDAAYIALGHTEDDRIETVLLNIIRGTGVDGLRGIPPRAGRIIRPLLSVTRNETAEYCREHGIPYREDPSNRSPRYLRSRVREELLPELAAYYNPAVRQAILRLSESAGDDSELLRALAHEALESAKLKEDADMIEIRREAIADLHPALGRRVLRIAVERIRGQLADVGFDTVESVLETARKREPFGVTLAGSNVRILGNAKTVTIGREPAGSSALPFEAALPIPGVLEASQVGGLFRVEAATIAKGYAPASLSNQCELDADSIRGKLVVRNRRPGDRIQPLGMAGTKKLQDLLVDSKVPKDQRDRIPVVADEEGALWVVGVAMSERARVTPETRHILRITFDS